MSKNSEKIGTGKIDTKAIYDVHRKVKELCLSYQDINRKVKAEMEKVNAVWSGSAKKDFDRQYSALIQKVDDFSDMLYELYDALVNAEVIYEQTDAELRTQMALQAQREKEKSPVLGQSKEFFG